jgi:hypothetical protein
MQAGAPIDPELAKLLEKCGIDPKSMSAGQGTPRPPAGGAPISCNIGRQSGEAPAPARTEPAKPEQPKRP